MVRFAEVSKKHGLVAKIVDQSWVVDDRLDVRAMPRQAVRLRWPAMARVIRATDMIRLEYQDLPELGFRQSGSPASRMLLARSARSTSSAGSTSAIASSSPGSATAIAEAVSEVK